jgi:acyl-CoA synthetase (AMP-forming)/AMP-acid ligase II
MRLRNVDNQGRGLLDLRGKWLFDHYVTASGPVRPFIDDGWFPTNDIASEINDEVFIYGREDEVAVIRGHNIYAEDVESVVASASSDQLGLFAAFRINEDAFSVAAEWLGISELDPNTVLTSIDEAVTEALGFRLHSVRICRSKTLPVTTSGKVRRSSCREMLVDWPEGSVIAQRC